jgi:hypothetical protein
MRVSAEIARSPRSGRAWPFRRTCNRRHPVDVKALSNIPALLIAGGSDEPAGTEDAETFWKHGREGHRGGSPSSPTARMRMTRALSGATGSSSPGLGLCFVTARVAGYWAPRNEPRDLHQRFKSAVQFVTTTIAVVFTGSDLFGVITRNR